MNTMRKKLIVYPLLLSIVLVSMLAYSTEYSFAAEAFDVSHGTKWVQGENIDSGLRIKTKGGSIAYCLNQGKASPSGEYTDKISLTSKLKAVLYLGYPNNKTFGNISLTNDQARCATQLAVWAHDTSNKGNKIDLSNLHGAYDKKPDGDNVLKAAKWLYNKADSGYTAPGKPTLAAPTFNKPGNNTPNFFNSEYVRVGPYRYTTTDNGYTSDNKVSVNLNGAPSGTKLGNNNGTFISSPIAGSDFYIYIPSGNLKAKGSGNFDINISYDYKYEKAAAFTAYKKDSTQNVAVAVKKEYTSGTKKTNDKADFGWTVGVLKKTDHDNKNKVIADTEFDIYLDPTPENTTNNDWKLMYKQKTDENGKMVVLGLGIGTYKLVETKPNPNHASNKEFGESDEIIFKVTDVNTESIQIMGNRAINISCEVDKDTIKKTSAAYKSLPNQEGFDNTKIEAYRYHVDYRSTANVWADEFVVDDPLEGVSMGQIRVTELWTPVCHGDSDGKMNLWYNTNKTDDKKVYSDVSALSSNPLNPNNPKNDSVKKNMGYKLWKENISTMERENLKVSELGLDEDEYITSLRLEHGKVERGFTTRNYKYESINDDTVVDWTPSKNDPFYTEESAAAKGLKPLTYLVMCPNPLSPPDIIENSAQSFIARNVHLTDDDEDKVYTEVIDSFKEEPIDETVEGEKEVLGEKGKVLGQKKVTKEAKTGDNSKLAVLIVLLIASVIILLVIMKKKTKAKFLPMVIIGVIAAGSTLVYNTDDVFADTKLTKDSFVRNGLEYSLTDSKKINGELKQDIFNVKYRVSQRTNSNTFDNAGKNEMLPKVMNVNIGEYKGKITLKKETVDPIYIKKQSQVDKVEVIKDLSIEDIKNLPESKVYKVRSNEYVDAEVNKELKRAGVSLKVSGYDDDGVPNRWDATLVFRGLESYLEKVKYNVKATYAGRISADSKEVKLTSNVKKDNDDLTVEKAKERNKELGMERYMQIKDNDKNIPKKIIKADNKPEGNGFKTGDIFKFLGFLLGLAAASFITFTFLIRRKRKEKI